MAATGLSESRSNVNVNGQLYIEKGVVNNGGIQHGYKKFEEAEDYLFVRPDNNGTVYQILAGEVCVDISGPAGVNKYIFLPYAWSHKGRIIKIINTMATYDGSDPIIIGVPEYTDENNNHILASGLTVMADTNKSIEWISDGISWFQTDEQDFVKPTPVDLTTLEPSGGGGGGN